MPYFPHLEKPVWIKISHDQNFNHAFCNNCIELSIASRPVKGSLIDHLVFGKWLSLISQGYIYHAHLIIEDIVLDVLWKCQNLGSNLGFVLVQARQKQIARLTREETLASLQVELSNRKRLRLAELRKFARPVSLCLDFLSKFLHSVTMHTWLQCIWICSIVGSTNTKKYSRYRILKSAAVFYSMIYCSQIVNVN